MAGEDGGGPLQFHGGTVVLWRWVEGRESEWGAWRPLGRTSRRSLGAFSDLTACDREVTGLQMERWPSLAPKKWILPVFFWSQAKWLWVSSWSLV